ncbi:acyl-CoA/acyl-ACP dehydrogenase [Rhodococcus pyridinivorans]|uniref:acyl-CoA dehydrogenase family protein n=1 Tax=Rhodococcus pyridinivorans TaxID=103816 RepID=UPI001E2D55DD|nr:acyl-CoA dehydrogenase family protein [Rhodococcus pyridinivorans]MCD5420333.1 acyl-CoA/acyl-ACP dehydrogenase [Rhodococcus pyridinivorans]
MTFETEDRAALRDSVRTLLAKHSDSAAVRRAITTGSGYDDELWTMLVEQVGVAALAVPEEYDGVGASWVEAHVVLEELGRTLTPSPFLGSAVLAAQTVLLSGDADAAARLLPGIAAGEVVAVCWASATGWQRPGVSAEGNVLTGTAHYVLGGDIASTLLVLAADGDTVGLFEVDPETDRVSRRRVPTMDPTRSLAEVSFSAVTGRRLSSSDDLVDRLRASAAIALSAEQVGAAQAVLDLTVDYAKNRKQFGRAIGSFQALKHRMADMYALVETARSMSYAAALSQDPQDAYAAKIYCSEAFQQVASEAVQLHGGIAITWEHDAQLFFKRAHGSAQLFGQPREYLSAISA